MFRDTSAAVRADGVGALGVIEGFQQGAGLRIVDELLGGNPFARMDRAHRLVLASGRGKTALGIALCFRSLLLLLNGRNLDCTCCNGHSRRLAQGYNR